MEGVGYQERGHQAHDTCGYLWLVGWLVVVGVVGGDDGVDEVVVDDDDDDVVVDVDVVCVVDFKSTGFNPSIKVNQVDFFNTSDILHKLCVRLH